MLRRAIIQYASDREYQDMLRLTRDIHGHYCKRHAIELIHDFKPPTRQPIWWRKVELLIEHIEAFDQIMWLDADCIIVAGEFNVFHASRFGIAVCECWDSPKVPRHLQCGVMLVTCSQQVKEFLHIWNRHPMQGIKKPHWGDQAAFIELMAGRPHRDLLTILPNRFNHETEHMESREPVYIEAFHGLENRIELMREFLKRG